MVEFRESRPGIASVTQPTARHTAPTSARYCLAVVVEATVLHEKLDKAARAVQSFTQWLLTYSEDTQAHCSTSQL